MKIEKLPSGSYRVRKTIDKKTYNMIFNHKPTETEILMELSKKFSNVIESEHIPFKVAASEYCKLKKNVLSPTTYREYTRTPDRLSENFNSIYIDQITSLQVQQEINNLSAKKSPKTVRNYHGFISAVIKMYRPDFVLNTTLPQKKVKEIYIPTDEDLKLIFNYAKTHCSGRYYIPIVLACYGMRRSEICALTCEDIIDNTVYINKAKVFDVNKEWIIKDYPKNETSVRTIPIPKDISDIISDQGYVYNGHPNDITCFIADACDALKISHFSIHKLRHYFCSRLSSENIDIETILKLGGWKTDYVMKSSYRHPVDKKVKEASDKLNGILFA